MGTWRKHKWGEELLCKVFFESGGEHTRWNILKFLGLLDFSLRQILTGIIKLLLGKQGPALGGEMEHGFFSLGRLILKGRKSEDFN